MKGLRTIWQNTPKVSPATRTNSKSRQKNYSRFFRTTRSHSSIGTPLSRRRATDLATLGDILRRLSTPPPRRLLTRRARRRGRRERPERAPPQQTFAPQKHSLQLFEMTCLLNKLSGTVFALFFVCVYSSTLFPPTDHRLACQRGVISTRQFLCQ